MTMKMLGSSLTLFASLENAPSCSLHCLIRIAKSLLSIYYKSVRWLDKSGWCWFIVRGKYCIMANKPWLKPTSEQAAKKDK